MFKDQNTNPPRVTVTRSPLTEGFRSRTEVGLKSKKWLWIAAAVFAGTIALVALLLFIRAQKQLSEVKKDLETVQSDPVAKTREANKELIAKVGKLIILPTNEEPTIATVSDLSKLKNQPFFAKAELGDKVLIYQIDKKAILYRPSTNQIIELAPLNNSSQPGTPTGTTPPATQPTATPPPTPAQ